MTEMISITKEEYSRLLKYKKLVLDFEKKLHSEDIYYKAAVSISNEVKKGKIKVYSGKEVL